MNTPGVTKLPSTGGVGGGSGNDQYRATTRKTGLGHHAILVTTPATPISSLRLRITSNLTTTGTYFVVDNFVLKKYLPGAVEQTTSYSTDFDAAVMSGVNVNDNGQLWTPFNSSITSLSVDDSTDRRIKVTCTDVNSSRIKTTRALAGGYHYTLRFSLAEDSADKRMFLNVFARIGGVWTGTLYQGLFYFGTSNNLLNMEWPAGADSIRVEFLRFSTPASYDGLTTPYYIDNFSITRLDTVSKRKVTVCDPPPAGEDKEGLYRFGFNGKENDNEVKGEGNQQDYGMRVYDPRLGKFLSVDPIGKKFPYYTPYQYAGNKPIWCVDLDGLEDLPSTALNKYGEKQVYEIVSMSEYTSAGPLSISAEKVIPSYAQPVTKGMTEQQVYQLAFFRYAMPGKVVIGNNQYIDETLMKAEQQIGYFFSQCAHL